MVEKFGGKFSLLLNDGDVTLFELPQLLLLHPLQLGRIFHLKPEFRIQVDEKQSSNSGHRKAAGSRAVENVHLVSVIVNEPLKNSSQQVTSCI